MQTGKTYFTLLGTGKKSNNTMGLGERSKLCHLLQQMIHPCLLPVIPASTSLMEGCFSGTCLLPSKESRMGLTTAGRKRPIPPIRQEAATTGSCAMNILNFSITGIFVSLSPNF
uniref:Uncharacterized protein n=1 Tax=Populus davidiana TaxID=266767 RepID=A0A6M2EMZ9_9ROSI